MLLTAERHRHRNRKGITRGGTEQQPGFLAQLAQRRKGKEGLGEVLTAPGPQR